jgi:hypothetical protein
MIAQLNSNQLRVNKISGLLELPTFNPLVARSNPAQPTKNSSIKKDYLLWRVILFLSLDLHDREFYGATFNEQETQYPDLWRGLN